MPCTKVGSAGLPSPGRETFAAEAGMTASCSPPTFERSIQMRSHDATQPPGLSRFFTLRKARREARERFLSGRKAERQYALKLRQVAQQIDHIVRGIAPDGVVADITVLMATLNHYGDLLKPWAEAVASRMIEDVSRRDAAAWEAHGKAIGQALRKEIDSAPTGAAMRASLAEQVQYITSLPRQAANAFTSYPWKLYRKASGPARSQKRF